MLARPQPPSIDTAEINRKTAMKPYSHDKYRGWPQLPQIDGWRLAICGKSRNGGVTPRHFMVFASHTLASTVEVPLGGESPTEN